MNRILIVGATSAIAEAVARLFATRNDRIYLLARNAERLDSLARDLQIRGAESVKYGVLDANHFDMHEAALDAAIAALGGLDVVLLAHGTLGNQKECESDTAATLTELNTNAISVILLLTRLSNYLELQRHGTVVVIGSVAGDRGRKSNYVYGTAKAAVHTFLQGLRNRLYRSEVHVLTIKPGFVDTPMTRDFKKGLLWAAPEHVAHKIITAIDRRKNCSYIPWFWRPIMMVIKSIPESVFKRLSL